MTLHSSLGKQGSPSHCWDTKYGVCDAIYDWSCRSYAKHDNEHASANLVAPESAISERPRSRGHKRSATELVDSDGSGHKHKKLHKKKWAKQYLVHIQVKSLDSEWGNVSDFSSVVSHKGSRSNNNMSETLDFQTLLAEREEKCGTLILMMWYPEGGGTMRNI